MRNIYSVLVGNIGTVHVGHNKRKAEVICGEYVDQSAAGIGRAGNEPVMLFMNNVVIYDFDTCKEKTT